MSPLTHLLASWTLAAGTTRNARDCRLVTLAGIAPDLDGLGLVVDLVNGLLDRPVTFLYAEGHHWWLHGFAGALAVAGLLTCFGRDKGRVLGLCLLSFHLHLLGDLVGARGPDPTDIWPLHYFGPFSREPVWSWSGQWALNAWPNRLFTLVLLGPCLIWPVKLGHSVVGVFHRRADAAVVATLRRWWLRATARTS